MVLRPRQHRYTLYGRRFLQVKRLNQQYQSTEGESYKRKPREHKENTKYTYKNSSPSVYSDMGWVEYGSHREQGCQAWTVAGLKLVDSSWPCSRLAADRIDNQY